MLQPTNPHRQRLSRPNLMLRRRGQALCRCLVTPHLPQISRSASWTRARIRKLPRLRRARSPLQCHLCPCLLPCWRHCDLNILVDWSVEQLLIVREQVFNLTCCLAQTETCLFPVSFLDQVQARNVVSVTFASLKFAQRRSAC
jgi:hypothetical protein